MGEYLHGGDIYSQETELDYSANISPLGLPEGVRQAVIKNLDSFCAYPDSRCRRLIQALAGCHELKPAHIICGNGAADLIFQIALAVKPKRALLLAPSFIEYEQALKAVGTEISYCYLKEEQDFRLDTDDWIKGLEASVDIAFLCNPNNPTGIAVPVAEVRRIAEACREQNVLLVIDECFMEFLDEPQKYSFLKEAENYHNVFILKAFTKIYAMAGFRLGYGICGNTRILSAMEEVRQPWSVSGIAQEAGIAALREKEYIWEVRRLISREREFLKNGLEKLSFGVYPSQANYLFFYAPDDGEGEDSLFEKMKRKKILIRSCHNYQGLGRGYYRVCVKDRKNNEKLLAALEGTR